MALALGAHTSLAVSTAATAAQTSSAIATTTGSTVVVLACYVGTWVSLTDSQSNTWVQVGTEQTVGGVLCRAYRCANLIGNAAHTFTVTLTTPPAALSFWVVEATGATTASIDGETIGVDAVTPFDSPGLTTTQANEMLVSIIAEDAVSNTYAHTCGNSFTAITADEVTNASLFITGISSYRIVSSTGTYNASVTISPAGTTSTGTVLVAIKQASGGVAGPVPFVGRRLQQLNFQ